MLDLTKSTEAQLVDIINRNNPGLNLQVEQVQFESPTVVTDVSKKANTRIVAKAILGRGFKGDVTLHYNRYQLALFATTGAVVLPVNSETPTWAEVLAAFNTFFGTQLTEVDLPPQPIQSLAATFKAGPQSLMFIGELPVTLQLV